MRNSFFLGASVLAVVVLFLALYKNHLNIFLLVCFGIALILGFWTDTQAKKVRTQAEFKLIFPNKLYENYQYLIGNLKFVRERIALIDNRSSLEDLQTILWGVEQLNTLFEDDEYVNERKRLWNVISAIKSEIELYDSARDIDTKSIKAELYELVSNLLHMNFFAWERHYKVMSRQF